MVRYDAEIRKPEDILFRSSRPQRNSSHIPRARDWRYATGVFRHEDIVDACNEATIWDHMDRDFNMRKAGRKRKSDEKEVMIDDNQGDGIWSHKTVDTKVNGEGGREEKKTPSPRKNTRSLTASPKKDILKTRSRAIRVGIFEPTGDTVGKREYVQTGLIVRLKHAGKTPVYTARMLAKPSVSTPKKLDRRHTPTMGFRTLGAPPTPPSTVKSVSHGRSKSSTPIERSTPRCGSDTSYVNINTSDETVTANVVLPIRDVFTFPLLAIIAMAGEGVKMGLENASQRKKVREEEEELRRSKPMETDMPEVTLKPDHGPEIEREIRDPASHPRKENEAKKPCDTPQVSRELQRAMAYPHEQNELHESPCVANDIEDPQGVPAFPPKEATVLEESQTTGTMTPPTNSAILAPKRISPRPMLHLSEQGTTAIVLLPIVPNPPETTNMASESSVPNAQSRAPIVVDEIAEATINTEEMSDAETRSRILEVWKQAREAALEPSERRDEEKIDQHPATLEQTQEELEKRLNALLGQEEEQKDLAMPDMHAEQARTEREKSEILLGEGERQENVMNGEDLVLSTEQAQAELEKRRRILLEQIKKQADVSKSDRVLVQVEVIQKSEAQSGQIKEYTGGNVQEYDGSAADRKATPSEEAEAEMKEFFDEMVEKVNAAPVGFSTSHLPPRPPTTEAQRLTSELPPIDYDTHGNPIPRTPKRALDDEHENGIHKKSKVIPFASTSNVVSNRPWHRHGASSGPRTSNYHSRGSQQYHGGQPHHSSGYALGATQPYYQTQPSSVARPYPYAQYPAPSNFSANHGYFGGHSYPHAYHPPAALSSGSHGSYHIQQYTGPTVGAGLHYPSAPTDRNASTSRGGTYRGSQNPPGREERGRYNSYGRR
jgi:hypothetical protein